MFFNSKSLEREHFKNVIKRLKWIYLIYKYGNTNLNRVKMFDYILFVWGEIGTVRKLEREKTSTLELIYFMKMYDSRENNPTDLKIYISNRHPIVQMTVT